MTVKELIAALHKLQPEAAACLDVMVPDYEMMHGWFDVESVTLVVHEGHTFIELR